MGDPRWEATEKARALARPYGASERDLDAAPVGASVVFYEPTFRRPMVAMKLGANRWVGKHGSWTSQELAERRVTALGGVNHG